MGAIDFALCHSHKSLRRGAGHDPIVVGEVAGKGGRISLAETQVKLERRADLLV